MLSTATINEIGFRQMEAGEQVNAAFHSLHVYEVRGFTVETDVVLTNTGSVNGHVYTIGVGSSVNAISGAILGDDFTDDEGKWAEEHKSNPPYVMIHIGPTEMQSCNNGFIKTDDSEIRTYDAFPQAREELRSLEEQIIPAVESALASAYSTDGRTTKFVPITREAFGLTADETIVHDVRIQARAEGYVSTVLSAETISAGLTATTALAETIDPKVARFYQLGLRDQDPVKRFLYFFLALEIHTHKVFSSIDHAGQLERLLNAPQRVRTGVKRMLETSHSSWNLMDRFTWCALCVWPQTSDAEIDTFRRLKRVRNDIAHGVLTAPSTADVRAVEELATMLLRPQT